MHHAISVSQSHKSTYRAQLLRQWGSSVQTDHARVSGLLQLQQGNQQIRNGVGHSQSDPSYPMGAASAEMLHREQFGASVHSEPDSAEHQHECTRDIPTAEYRAIQKVFHIPMAGNGQDTPAATTEAEERQTRS